MSAFLFDDPNYTRRIDADAARRPALAPVLGVAEQAGLGLMRGGAQLARTVGIAAGGVANVFSEDAGDAVFEFTDDYGTDAVDYWTPDPRMTTTAGRIVGGLAEAAIPLMLGGGSPVPLMADIGLRSAERVADLGVDTAPAAAVGMIDSMAIGLGFKIPMVGTTLARSLGLGVVANPVLGGAAEGAQGALLNATGDEQAAKQFNPFDLERRGVETLLGLAFGGVGHAVSRGMRGKGQGEIVEPEGSPSVDYEPLGPQNPLGIDRDALLTYRNGAHLESRAPGAPEDIRANNAHQVAMREQISAMAEGRESNAVNALGDARFVRGADFDAHVVGRAETALPAFEESRLTLDDYESALPPRRREEAITARDDIARGAVALDENRDVVLTFEDGSAVLGREAMTMARQRVEEVQTTYRRATEAAITCFLRQG